MIAVLAATLWVRPCAAEPTDAELKRMLAEQRVALVIGNGQYRNFEPLDNPANDAKGVAAALRMAGFQVLDRTDVTREEMYQALDEFDRVSSQAPVALFYFAGHATQVDSHNFMLPVAAKLDASVVTAANPALEVAEQTVDLSAVLERMGRADRRINIVILDACRNNPFTTRARDLSRALAISTGKAPAHVGLGLGESPAPPRTYLAYATAPGQVADDGTGRHSPYSGALIDVLSKPSLQLEQVFKEVRNSVAKATQGRQIPWENSSAFDDFYFHIPAPKGTNSNFVPP